MIGRRELVLWGTAGLLAASLRGALAPPPADQTMRYDFVREAGQWKIDDIRGSADGKPWTVCGMLAASRKYWGLQRWPAAGDRQAITYGLLRMIGEFLIAQAPILPELKPAQEDRDSAEHDVPDPERLVAGIAEDEG